MISFKNKLKQTLIIFFTGLTFSASAVGTAAGFLSGGIVAQNYYVEFDRVDADRFVSLLDV